MVLAFAGLGFVRVVGVFLEGLLEVLFGFTDLFFFTLRFEFFAIHIFLAFSR